MMTTFIYILICPMDGLVKYVGKSNNPYKRAKDHMLDFRNMDLNKSLWITKLKQQKKRPELVIIDEIDLFDWKYWEHWWCSYFKSLGFKLYNSRSRNGLTYSNSKTFKPGNVPWNYGLRKNKQNISEEDDDLPF